MIVPSSGGDREVGLPPLPASVLWWPLWDRPPVRILRPSRCPWYVGAWWLQNLASHSTTHHANQKWVVHLVSDVIFSSCAWLLTLCITVAEYSIWTRSISCKLMTWLLTSPSHQQAWYWLENKYVLVCHDKWFQLHVQYLCHLSVGKRQKIYIDPCFLQTV